MLEVALYTAVAGVCDSRLGRPAVARCAVETGDELVCELFVVSGVDGPAGGRVAATPRAFRFPECVRARVE